MLLLLSRRKNIYYFIEQNNSCTSWTGIGSLFLWVKKKRLWSVTVSVFEWSPEVFRDHSNELDGSERPFVTINLRVWMVTEGFFFCDHPTNIINFYIAFGWWRKVFGDVLTDAETDVDHKRFRIHLLLTKIEQNYGPIQESHLDGYYPIKIPFQKK